MPRLGIQTWLRRGVGLGRDGARLGGDRRAIDRAAIADGSGAELVGAPLRDRGGRPRAGRARRWGRALGPPRATGSAGGASSARRRRMALAVHGRSRTDTGGQGEPGDLPRKHGRKEQRKQQAT